MRILLYADDKNKIPAELSQDIQNIAPASQIDVLNSLSDLSEVLCKPLNKVMAIVAWPYGPDEISLLSSLKHLFENIRLILVLPERNHLFLSLGIGLKPCFITYPDNDAGDIVSVLGQIRKINGEG